MRHGRKVKKLSRTPAHRKAMLSNMATSLIMHSTIKTTPGKARAVCRVVDRLVSLAKRDDLHARRLAATTIRDKAALKRLFSDIGPQLTSRNGGYTRTLRWGTRHGDNAPISVVQLLVEKAQPEAEAKTKKKKGKTKTEAPEEK